MNAPVSVAALFDHKHRVVQIAMVWYDGNCYEIDKIAFSYNHKIGRTLFHVFTVLSGATYLKLQLDSELLNWKLLEIRHRELD